MIFMRIAALLWEGKDEGRGSWSTPKNNTMVFLSKTGIVALLGLWTTFFSLAPFAASTEALKAYLTQTTSLKGRFSQTVMDKNMKPLQQSSGTLAFSRPGKFRWEYTKPYEQSIVGDGQRLWIYDKDLNQVTVRKLDQALGSSPAALLAGNNEIDKNFRLSNLGSMGGLDWLEATPKMKDTSFENLTLWFSKEGLSVMKLRDAFGQLTVIEFSDTVKNPILSAETFRFVPPAGVDVVRE